MYFQFPFQYGEEVSSNEVYPHSPLALALVELRHPASEPLTVPALSAIKKALSSVTPIQRREDSMTLNIQTGTQEVASVPKFVSRDQQTAVTFRPDAVVVETTKYKSYESFRSLLETAAKARHGVDPLDAIERVGLRYVDEIRAPEDASISWEDWVSPKLLGPGVPASLPGLSIVQQQGITVFQSGTPGDSLTLRYGPLVGQAVGSTPNLVRPGVFEGPFFLIDIDGAWTPPTGVIPEFDVEEILQVCDRLHSPIKDVFESLISEKLRNEVLRNDG
ncbi:TIGR04255 family protein [Arthrobacter sp. BB-1]|nr:TIGR04255 family protein [Arthrobacter sp. BB-1]